MISSMSSTHGIACRFQPAQRFRSQVGLSSRSLEFLGSLAISRPPSVRPARNDRYDRRRADLLQRADKVGRYVGVDPGSLWLQYEGMNPSGSFKDNGMTAAFTHARMVSARRVACASTGNTSAALSVYCSATDLGFRAIIFVGSGKIAYGKLCSSRPRSTDDSDRRRL